MFSFKHRLLLAEDEFVSALAQGGDAIDSFDRTWATLMGDIDSAIQSTGLDAETSTLAHTIASRIAILADASAEIVANYDSITSELVDEMNTLMSQVALVDPISSESSHLLLDCSLRRRRSSGSLSSQGISNDSSQRPRRVARRKLNPVPNDEVDDEKRLVTTSTSRIPLPEPSPAPRTSSKRRLSESDLSRQPKRHRFLYAGPRLHAVSDTYPSLRPFSAAAESPISLPLIPAHTTPPSRSSTMLEHVQSSHQWDIRELQRETFSTLAAPVSEFDGGLLSAQIQPDPKGFTSLSELDGLHAFLTSIMGPQCSTIGQTSIWDDVLNEPLDGMHSPTASSRNHDLSSIPSLSSPTSTLSRASTPLCPRTPPIDNFPHFHPLAPGTDPSVDFFHSELGLRSPTPGAERSWQEYPYSLGLTTTEHKVMGSDLTNIDIVDWRTVFEHVEPLTLSPPTSPKNTYPTPDVRFDFVLDVPSETSAACITQMPLFLGLSPHTARSYVIQKDP
ncbi:hypothetical protein C8Q74DRAFT_1240262 [Fomes fomentarius]|nr:hypothetical protein C8Q74DRAFT_1240262 [Fomes fomentarius]